jgi:phenylacetate-CoA ligase
MAGMAYYSGITRLGSCVYRAGMYNAKKHINLINKLRPTGIVTVPSFLVRLIETFKEEGFNPEECSIKKALLVGESIRDRDFELNQIGRLISDNWPMDLYSTYGNSECGISFCECGKKCGGHEHPDLIISEILEEDGSCVRDGDPGELVLTSLQSKGMPLIRYQTGDITFKLTEKCGCGRHSSRIGPVLGRKAQMMKFKGVKVYPKVIENAVLAVEGVYNHIIEAFTGNDYSDKIIVKVGCKENSQRLKDEIAKNIQAHARVTPHIELLTIEEVEDLRTEGGTRRKVRVFIDNRENNGF